MRNIFLVLIFIMMTTGVYVIVKLPDLSTSDQFHQPNVVVYGTTIRELSETLDKKCIIKWVRKIDPPFLDNVNHLQQQIDCIGFPFYGKRRFAEFIIADNSLEAVWILTKKEDESILREAMISAYGAPDMAGENIEIFSAAGAALRKDKPEVVFYSDRLSPYVKAFLNRNE